MKVNKTLAALIASASLGLSGHAFAAGTDAGVDITNTVNLGYKVNNVPQQNVTSEAAFKVDTRVDMTLTDNTGSSEVAPGSTVTYTYNLANTGNDTLYFDLDIVNQAAAGDTGDITIGSITFTKTGGTGTSSINAGRVTLAEDADITFTAEFTFPTQTSGGDDIVHNDTFNVLASATAVQSDGTALTDGKGINKNSGTNLTDESLNVFAEAASLESIALNAEITVGTTTTVKSAWFTDGSQNNGPALSLLVVNDDLCDATYDSTTPAYGNYTAGNGVVTCDDTSYSPKALPGSLVEYTLFTENEGAAIAQDAVFALTLADINGFLATVDTGADAFQASSLANVTVNFVKGSGTANPSRDATDTSTALALDVAVDFFEPGDTITIKFTAIVE